VYGTCAITAVTAQNTVGVSMVEAMSPAIVAAQIAAVATDIGVHAAKTGMLANAAIVRAVAEAVAGYSIPFLVVDPVMLAKSGDTLLDQDALIALETVLLPLAHVVTPNVPEAEALAGLPIRSDADRKEAARRIGDFGARAVVIKGGHWPSDDISDLLYDGTAFEEFHHERVPGRHTHGTGCTFAAAIAAHLALGRSLAEAIPLTQRYLAGAIRAGLPFGKGHGPMDHFWNR
jgi:hydroxymethylpyrimidine/phosphomethylpyrimidine kinase